MDRFPVPIQSDEEEKLFGGILTVRQMIYLVAGGSLAAFAAAFPLPAWVRVMLALAVIAGATALAFVKTDGVRLDRYLLLYAAYRRRQREFV